MEVTRHHTAPVQVLLDYANADMKADSPDTFFLEVHRKKPYQKSDTYCIRPVYGCTAAEFKREYPLPHGTLSYIAHGCICFSENMYDSSLEVSKEEFLVDAALQGLNPEIEFVYDERENEVDCRIIGGESLQSKQKKSVCKCRAECSA